MSAQLAMVAETTAQSRTREILGVAISDITRAEALALLGHAIQARRHMKLAFCNAHTANLAWSDPSFQRMLAGFTVFPDGVGVDMGAKTLFGAPFTSNLNGTDFVPDFLQAAPLPLRIAMIGGKPGIAPRAAAQLASMFPRHGFAPTLDGYQSEPAVTAFLKQLAQQPVDVLLVAMGNPLQENWIARNITAEHATLAIGVGALFDFLAGEVSRAPVSVRRLRLEWAWRLAQEPRRLFRRYVLGNPLFLARVILVKLGLARR